MYLKLLAAIVVTVAASNLEAQTTCKAEVSYKWKSSGEAKEAQEATVYFGGVEGAGADEVVAKAKLTEESSVLKVKALDACRRDRENLTGCITAKFATSAQALQSLSFSARKALEEAISADCKKSQGSCLDATVSEPACQSAAVAPEGTPEAEDGKKQDAGKKKK